MGIVSANLLAAIVSLTAPVATFTETASPLRATGASLTHENRRADADDLSRMRDRAMIRRFARAKLLVRVPYRTRHFYLKSIPFAYRYLRPWSKLFLDRLSRQFYARFRKRLRVTSLVRTVSWQRALQKRNRNAAAAYGPRRSTHLTGATLDISKKGMTGREIDWMRRVLYSLKQGEYLYAVEEFQQPTFHIMVYKNYPRYVKRVQSRSPR